MATTGDLEIKLANLGKDTPIGDERAGHLAPDLNQLPRKVQSFRIIFQVFDTEPVKSANILDLQNGSAHIMCDLRTAKRLMQNLAPIMSETYVVLEACFAERPDSRILGEILAFCGEHWGRHALLRLTEHKPAVAPRTETNP